MPPAARRTGRQEAARGGGGEDGRLHEPRNRQAPEMFRPDHRTKAWPHPHGLGKGDGSMSGNIANGDSFYDDINLACERFEAEWRSGGRPQIELYLVEAPEGARRELIRELLKLEIYYRRDRGDTIGADDY